MLSTWMCLVFVCVTLHSKCTSGNHHNNCSSLHTFVEITSPSNLSQTLFSLKALFGPQTIEPIGPLPLQTLSTNSTNITNSSLACSSISMNLTGKIVLIWTRTPLVCSYETKVMNAQNAGASAVLISHHTSVTFEMPREKNSTKKILIPSRMISYQDGTVLEKATNKSMVMIQFGCVNHNISLVICVTAPRGAQEMDGEYQLQLSLKISQHSVYKKTGNKAYRTPDLFVLYHLTLQNQWRWVISPTMNPKSSTDFWAQCLNAGAKFVHECTRWSNRCPNRGCVASGLTVGKGLCTRKPSVFCMTSNKFWADGEYVQHGVNTPKWNRVLIPSDNHAASIQYWWAFTWWGFVVTYNNTYYARCFSFSDRDPSACRFWSVFNSFTQRMEYDSTFKVERLPSGKSSCFPPKNITTTIPPSTLCILNHKLWKHNVIMTTYRRERNRLNGYDVWKGHPNPLIAPGKQNEAIYLFHGTESPSWFLGNSLGIENQSVRGVCASATLNPQDCKALWHFPVEYVNVIGRKTILYDPDRSVEVLTGACPFETQVLCLTLSSSDANARYDLVGPFTMKIVPREAVRYMRNSTSTSGVRYEIVFGEGTKTWLIRRITSSVSKDIMECTGKNLASPLDCAGWNILDPLLKTTTVSLKAGHLYTCPVQHMIGKKSECRLNFEIAKVYTTSLSNRELKSGIAVGYGINVGDIESMWFTSSSSHSDMQTVNVNILRSCSSMNSTGRACSRVTDQLTLPSSAAKPPFSCRGNLNAVSTKASSSASSTSTRESNAGVVALAVIMSLFGVCGLVAVIYFVKANQLCCFATAGSSQFSEEIFDVEQEQRGYDMEAVDVGKTTTRGRTPSVSSEVRAPSREPSLDPPPEPDSDPEPEVLEELERKFSSTPIADPFQPVETNRDENQGADEPAANTADPFAPPTPF